VPPDTTAPTVEITSPQPGSWTLVGSGSLSAAWACADETELVACEGSVDGDPIEEGPVPDGSPGTHTLTVQALDAAGHTAEAEVSYLVFDDVQGSLVSSGPARAGHKLKLSLGMGLPKKGPAPLATATAQPVDCVTGAPIGSPVEADLKVKVHRHGSLDVKWDTDRSWSGCWTLTLGFAAEGWDGPATFGPVELAGKPGKP
jgi:hypothetical protein